MTSVVAIKPTTHFVSQATKTSSQSPHLNPHLEPETATSTATIVPLTDLPTLTKCLTTLSSAFSVVPCTNAFAAESNQTVHAYVTKTILESIQCHGGVLLQAGDASAVALWEVPTPVTGSTTDSGPSRNHDNINSSDSPSTGDISMKQEWKTLVRAAKIQYIGVVDSPASTLKTGVAVIKPHYHLDFLARNPEVYPKVQGAISAVVRPYLSLAKKEGRNVWLEATSLDVVPLYEYYGFKVVEEILVGKGKVDGKGRLEEGGEGVKARLMVMDNSGGI
ncbi:hypothetical protein V8F20_002902 [Naviculisporaceae sp. PSN 640]